MRAAWRLSGRAHRIAAGGTHHIFLRGARYKAHKAKRGGTRIAWRHAARIAHHLCARNQAYRIFARALSSRRQHLCSSALAHASRAHLHSPRARLFRAHARHIGSASSACIGITRAASCSGLLAYWRSNRIIANAKWHAYGVSLRAFHAYAQSRQMRASRKQHSHIGIAARAASLCERIIQQHKALRLLHHITSRTRTSFAAHNPHAHRAENGTRTRFASNMPAIFQ